MAADMTFIATALSSVKVATDFTKGAIQLAGGLKNADLTQKLIDVQKALLETHEQIIAKHEEIGRQREEISSLQERVEFREILELDSKGELYRRKDAPVDETRRWCPVCFEAPGGETRRLIDKYAPVEETGLDGAWNAWFCANCIQHFRRTSADD